MYSNAVAKIFHSKENYRLKPSSSLSCTKTEDVLVRQGIEFALPEVQFHGPSIASVNERISVSYWNARA